MDLEGVWLLWRRIGSPFRTTRERVRDQGVRQRNEARRDRSVGVGVIAYWGRVVPRWSWRDAGHRPFPESSDAEVLRSGLGLFSRLGFRERGPVAGELALAGWDKRRRGEVLPLRKSRRGRLG